MKKAELVALVAAKLLGQNVLQIPASEDSAEIALAVKFAVQIVDEAEKQTK